LQEIYFALTDGTAYLHAYMHADGNIRYANYQSEAQVIAFLESHGFGTQTYGDWFA
jgi:serralysin